MLPEFADDLFGAGQPLVPAQYFIILPDRIGHDQSAQSSDGLRGRLPRNGYLDMVKAQRRLLAEGIGIDPLHWS